MKSFWFYLILVSILFLAQGGGSFIADSTILVVGTALPIQLAIYAVWKLAVFRPLRQGIAWTFSRMPVTLGFSFLVFIGAAVIFGVVASVRNYVSSSDSWFHVTFGILMGVMGPVFHGLKRSNIREQGAPSNGG